MENTGTSELLVLLDIHKVSSACGCKALRDPSRGAIIDQHRSGSASITNNMHIPMAGDNESLKFNAHQQTVLLMVVTQVPGSRKLHLNTEFHGLRGREEQKEPHTGSQCLCSKCLHVKRSHFIGPKQVTRS